MMKKNFLAIFLITISILGTFGQKKTNDVSQILRSGPMLGYSEMTETVIWLQTKEPAKVQIKFWKKGEKNSLKSSKIIQTVEENDHLARFTLSRLEFGTRYEYEVYLNNQKLKPDYQPSFQTQQHWRWRTEPPNFKFALGSCSYINDTPFDRPGKPYGDSFEIFQTIAEKQPDFMIWLGDNIYFREPDWLTESAMRYRYAQNRELPELRKLLATSHHYAIWDDHDYGPNDSDRTFRGKDWALKVFQDYWANNTYGHEDIKGIFGRFEWGDVEFFLLDDRYHRSPHRMPVGSPKTMLGEGQMRWLMESLRSSNATFKIIASGSQMLNEKNNFEAFKMFPEEQKQLFGFIREAKIDGVLFLSGDRHHTELIKREDLAEYSLYDFTSSPLTSGGGRVKTEEDNPHRVAGTWVTDSIRNFGMIEVTGTAKNRKLTLQTFDKNGKELWNYEILASDLRSKK